MLPAPGPLEVRPSPIHGLGGFALAQFAPGYRVLEYRGERISKAESLRLCARGNASLFYLDADWDLNGEVDWNPARWLNHSCAPNCEAKLLDNGIWIVTRRPIEPGDEVTFNYGYELHDLEDHPCHCGSPECVGYIVAEEFHELVRRRNLWRGTPSSLPLAPHR